MLKYEELKKRLQQNKKVSYPSIPKLCKNERYARLVYDSLGGKEGELTATTYRIERKNGYKLNSQRYSH